METIGYPTPEQILRVFAPFHPAFHVAAQRGAAEARRFFRERKRKIDRNLAPELFRHGAKVYFDGTGHKAIEEGSDYTREWQARNGLLVHCDTLHVRMLKLPRDGEPPPAQSDSRKAFYSQVQPLPFPVDPKATREAFNLLYLWNVSPEYVLIEQFLGLPRCGEEDADAEFLWKVRLQDPFSRPALEPVNEVAEDLPITLKKHKKTAEEDDDAR